MPVQRVVEYLIPLGLGAMLGLMILRTIPDLITFAALHEQMQPVRFVER